MVKTVCFYILLIMLFLVGLIIAIFEDIVIEKIQIFLKKIFKNEIVATIVGVILAISIAVLITWVLVLLRK